ncbi:FAD:protein FMN transferase [Hymenobacter sp. RP-2-7]|uniref:FAD:protein FMN transferase n=1 Tax=Hymenobacter polaris TaxID=2682546 RepID=A0A7Y0AB93_9BACT|nr:FAD:protein FMN transferase [Hymenobacter polaris]NML64148.1 FAD:protein FMN transferase [Hymenobacter polaris]
MSPIADPRTRHWAGSGLLALALLLMAARLRPAQAPPTRARAYTRAAHLMGSQFTFTAVSSDDSLAWRALRAGLRETQRIDHLCSYWDSTSQVVKINQLAGIRPVVVDQEVYDLIQRTLKIAALSGGAFDITFASGDKIYKFDRLAHPSLPDSATVRRSVRRIGWQKVQLNAAAHSVYLPEKGMRINLAGILQGYGVRRASEVMKRLGIAGGLLNGSGDVYCWGRQPDGSQWRIAIGDPARPRTVSSWLTVSDLAVVTAGNYEQYFTVGGRYYGHIINPHTGYPATGLRSVTIICPDVELADALDDAVFVLGPTEGLGLINRLKGVSATVITDDGQTLVSKGLQLNSYHSAAPAAAVSPPSNP